MTTKLTVLVYIGIALLITYGATLIYNAFLAVYYMWKNKFDGSNTGYEGKKIKQHGKSSLKYSLIILVIGLGLFLYYLPVEVENIAGGFDKVNRIYLSEYTQRGPSNVAVTDKNKISEILSILKQYKVRRSLQVSDFARSIRNGKDGEFIVLWLNSTDYRIHHTIEVSNQGYINSNNQDYVVTIENREEFFERLCKVITDK